MFLGVNLCVQRRKTISFDLRKARIRVVRQRYSDCAIISVDVYITFPNLPTLQYYVFLANRNKKKEVKCLLTKDEDESGKKAIFKELGNAMKKIGNYIISCVEKRENISAIGIRDCVWKTCLKLDN